MTPAAILESALYVDDLDKAEAFYGGVLGLEELKRPDFGMDGAWFESGTTQVHLSVGAPPPADAFQHFAFRTDDLGALVSRMRAEGVEVSEVPHIAGAGHQAFARDPAGNLIEFNQPD